MSTGSTDNGSSGEVTKHGLERLPVKTPFAHDAILRIQRLDATLGGLGLLEVAKGLLPAEIFEITILDLSDVPAPAPGAPAKDIIAFRKALADQKTNLKRRENVLITKRNNLYAALLETCKPHQKTIHDRLVKECDYGTERMDRWYADGALAYNIIIDFYANPKGRTEEDKLFYKLALEVQEKNMLPNKPLRQGGVPQEGGRVP